MQEKYYKDAKVWFNETKCKTLEEFSNVIGTYTSN